MGEDETCPLCAWPYVMLDGDMMLCLECGNQWNPAEEASN